MATNKDPIFLNTLFTKNLTFVNADGVTPKIVYTAGADGGAVEKLSATSTDTAARILVLTVSDGTDDAVIGEVSVPIGAGTDGSTPAKNLLDSAALPGVLQENGSLALGPSAVLSVNAKVAVTAAKAIDVSGQGGSYSA